MFEEILRLLDLNLSNASALLTLMSSMTSEEQQLVTDFIIQVLEETSFSDLKEKDVLVYLKLYLKTRKETETGLEELINDTQRERLEGL